MTTTLTFKVYVGQGPICYGPAISLHSVMTIYCRKIVLGMIDQCQSETDLVNYMWSVTYIAWSIDFCLISLSLILKYFII